MVSFNISNEAVGDTIIQMHRRLDWLLPSWYRNYHYYYLYYYYYYYYYYHYDNNDNRLEDADAYDQSIDEDMLTVYYTIAVNLIILGFCLIFFSIYRYTYYHYNNTINNNTINTITLSIQ